jgi:hypothetical protein
MEFDLQLFRGKPGSAVAKHKSVEGVESITATLEAAHQNTAASPKALTSDELFRIKDEMRDFENRKPYVRRLLATIDERDERIASLEQRIAAAFAVKEEYDRYGYKNQRVTRVFEALTDTKDGTQRG